MQIAVGCIGRDGCNASVDGFCLRILAGVVDVVCTIRALVGEVLGNSIAAFCITADGNILLQVISAMPFRPPMT